MGIELELIILFILQTLGTAIFDRFEIELPIIKKILRWFITLGITLVLYYYLAHWALVFPLVFALFGLYIHFSWCKKHQIHPIKATPRKKYYELRGWVINDN